MRPAPYFFVIGIHLASCGGAPSPAAPRPAATIPIASAPRATNPAPEALRPRAPVVGIPSYVPQAGHSGEVSALAWNENATLLASASKEDGVKLWAMPEGSAVAELRTRDTDPSSLAFSPDGRSLAVANWSGALEIWDLAELRPRSTHRDHKGSVQSLAYTPDGALLVTGGEDGTIQIYETRSQKLRGLITGMPAAVYAMAFSPDGKRLACSAGSKVQIRETGTWRPLHALEAHTKPVTSVAWSPDGKELATGGEDGLLLLWSADQGAMSRKIEASHGVQALAWNDSGDAIAAATDDGWETAWSSNAGEQVRQSRCVRCLTAAAAFSPSARFVARADDDLRVTDMASGESPLSVEWKAPREFEWCSGTDKFLVRDARQQMHQVEIDHVSASPVPWWPSTDLSSSWSLDGSRLAVVDERGDVIVVDTRDGKQVAAYAGEGLGLPAVSLSPDGKRAALYDPNAGVWLWSVGTRTMRRLGDSAAAAAWSADGSTLATAEKKSLRLLAASTATEISRIPLDVLLADISFRPGAKQVAAIERESGRIHVWDTTTRREVAVIDGPASPLQLVYSPDGRWLAAAGEKSGARVWEAQTGKLRQSVEAGRFHLSWHRGSKVLALSGREEILLRVEDAEALRVEVGGEPARALVFASDGLYDGAPSPSSKARFRIGKGVVDFGIISPLQLPAGYKHQGLLRDFVEGRPLPHPQAGVAAQPH